MTNALLKGLHSVVDPHRHLSSVTLGDAIKINRSSTASADATAVQSAYCLIAGGEISALLLRDNNQAYLPLGVYMDAPLRSFNLAQSCSDPAAQKICRDAAHAWVHAAIAEATILELRSNWEIISTREAFLSLDVAVREHWRHPNDARARRVGRSFGDLIKTLVLNDQQEWTRPLRSARPLKESVWNLSPKRK